jgi:uncharacterized phage protein (TIGR02218 family)
MIAYVYSGTSVFLLPYMPDWSEAVTAEFELPVEIETGLSNREQRELTGATFRTVHKYSAFLNSTEAAQLRAALAVFDNRPILCPFWPSECLLTGAPHAPAVGGALKIFYEPTWTNYEVNTTGAPTTFTPSAACLVSPVLWGRFTQKLPESVVVNGLDYETCEFDLTENGSAAFALTPTAVALTAGPNVNGFTVPQLTVPFHWGENKALGDVVIHRDKVGYGRGDTDSFYPQSPRMINTLNFSALNLSEINYLLSLFMQSAGTVFPIWVCPPNTPLIANAIFGRFFTEKFMMQWDLPARAGETAQCQLQFVSLPTEVAVPTGEIFAETLGPLPEKWFGYMVTDGTLTWYYTSYESPVAGPGGTFQPAQISHGTIEDEINLQQNDCTLTVQSFPNSPFLRLRNNFNAEQLTVTIYEGYLSAPTLAVPIYTGYCVSPKTTGQKWEIKLRGLGAKLDIKGPHLLLQPTCNASFCDSRCTLSTSAFEITETLNYVTSGNVLSFGATTLGGALAAGRFQTGQAQRPWAGTIQNIFILDSYALGDGTLGIVLGAPLAPAPTGAEPGWVLIPGCDGQFATCQGYGNEVNFRGMPWVPAQDPSIPPVTTPTGKKG